MSAKHTPGPWYSRPAASGARDFGICASAPSARLGVVVVAEVFAELEYEGERSEQTQRNARLIAAAPDLLAALQAVVDGYESLLADRLPAKQKALATQLPAIVEARAVIAKATGEPA